MRKKKETYKTDHPTIKEISIGDQFVTESGTIVELFIYDKKDYLAPFRFNNYLYTPNLKFWRINGDYNIVHSLDIKQKYISLKEKIDLL